MLAFDKQQKPRKARIRDVFEVDVMTYSESSNKEAVQNQLNQWAKSAFIEIVKPLAEFKDMEPCIKLLGRIQSHPLQYEIIYNL